MAQFDLYPQRDAAGFWLDCQTELLEDYNTRFVVPLVPPEFAPSAARQLNPIFIIGGMPHVMLTHYAGSIQASELRNPAGSLANHRYEIINALDFLITGV